MRVPKHVLTVARGQLVLFSFPQSGDDPQVTVKATLGDEINFSLRTRNPHVAKERTGLAIAYLEQLFAHIRAGPEPLSHKQCVALSGEAYKLFIEKFDENPGARETWEAVKGLNRAAREGRLLPRLPALKPEEIASARAAVADLGPDLTAAINAHPEDEAKQLALLEQRYGFLGDWVLTTNAIVTDEKSRARLLFEVDKATTQAAVRLKRAADGDYSPDDKASRFPEWKPEVGGAGDRSRTLTWDALIAHWEVQHSSRRGPASTRQQWRAAVERFAKWCKKSDPREVAASDVRAWRDHLSTNENLAPKTVNGVYLAALRTIYTAGCEEEILTSNPAEGVRLLRAQSRKMGGFSDEIAARVLAAAASEKKPARRWVPWLCALTGSRVREIINLRAKDIIERDGCWCLNITREAGAVKTRASERVVPIHTAIVDAGFLDFAAGKAASDRLFCSEMLHAKGAGAGANSKRIEHQGKAAANRLREWLHTLGLPIGRKYGVDVNHGWRHWFKTVAREAGVEDSVIDAIVGHAPATVGSRYGVVTVRAMAQALGKIPVPQLKSKAHKGLG